MTGISKEIPSAGATSVCLSCAKMTSVCLATYLTHSLLQLLVLPLLDCLCHWRHHHWYTLLLPQQSLMFFLQVCADHFQSAQPDQDVAAILVSFHMLLGGTAMALHPLILDALVAACRTRPKFREDILRETPSNVRQELITSPSSLLTWWRLVIKQSLRL